jgi:hypothetical protein
MTLEEIFNSGEISVRSYNICASNQLNNLNAILYHFQKNKNFQKLRNCGTKSNIELIDLCEKYLKIKNEQFVELALFELQIEEPENEFISVVSNLPRMQREIVNTFIEINFTNLSIRGQNAISSFLNYNIKIRNLSERILSNSKFNFQDIKNVGTRTVAELKTFIDSIIVFTEKVSKVENEIELITLSNRFFIERTFSVSSIPNEILESQSIFKIVDFLLNQDLIFDKKQSVIFKKAFKIFEGQIELTNDKIALNLNITKERVRQHKKKCLDELLNNLLFIKQFGDDLFQKNNIDLNQNLIFIDEEFNFKLNEKNETNFSREFSSVLIFSYISDRFDLIGEIEDILQPKFFNSRDRHNWENFYLVNKKISSHFNFNDFSNDINKRLSERIEESYNFNFNSYLLSFSTSTNLNGINDISEVVEKILNNEFGIYLDIDDNITFTRNSLKQAYQYAYEALEILGKPSKVNEITSKVVELHPDYETNDEKIRASMKRDNGFVPIGRRSIFGLKEWENEFENFKGGTIRSIVFEYLESKNDPKHISEIAEYVLNYRPNTYERSILDNLKADETKTFIFFKNSTIGLQSKKYDNSFVELNKIDFLETKSWEERFNDLIKFISINKRLPFSSGCPDEEIRLYRWYKVQKVKINKGKLDGEKCNLFSQIPIQFNRNDINRNKRTNSVERYIELKQFVLLNNRLPSANKTGEENLYHFFYKQRKLFEKGKLEQSEENQFIEIAIIIQNHEYENKRN